MRSFFLISLLSWHCFAGTKIVDQTWQNNNGAQKMTYQAPKPLDYILIPGDLQAASRDYQDYYSLEDHSTYEPVANTVPVRTDISMEDYYDKLVSGNTSLKTDTGGRGEDGQGADMADSGYQTYNTRSPSRPMVTRNLTFDDILPVSGGGAADLYSSFSIKLKPGLIYRDRFACGTGFEHLKYDSNEEEQRDADGNTSTVTDAQYCFFIFIPGINRGASHPDGQFDGPWLSPVHPDDADSLKAIQSGLVPYLPLKDDLKTRLTSGNGGIVWMAGRYMVPMKWGKMVLPHNGLNLLYNRYTISRMYHHDREKIEKKKSKGWLFLIVAIVVGVVTFGMGAALSVALIAGATTGMLMCDPGYSMSYGGAGTGQKAKWANPYGSSYLALQPENQVRKVWPPLYNVMDLGVEKKFLCSALGFISANPWCAGVATESLPIEVNSDRDDIDNLSVITAKLTALNPDMRFYQFHPVSAYNLNSNAAGSATTVGGGGGVLMSACGGSDAAMQAQCARWTPLINDLNTWFTTYAPAGTDLPTILGPGTGTTVSIGPVSHTFSVSTAYKALGDVRNNHAALIAEVENPNQDPPPDTIRFFSSTQEGAALGDQLRKIDDATKVTDPQYADLWFVTGNENGKFDTEITPKFSACKSAWQTSTNLDPAARDAALHTCLKGDTAPVLTTYTNIEDNQFTSGPFSWYTEKNTDGQKLLGKLTYLEDYIKGPAGSPKAFGDYFDTANRCPEIPVFSFVTCAAQKFASTGISVNNLDKRYDD